MELHQLRDLAIVLLALASGYDRIASYINARSYTRTMAQTPPVHPAVEAPHGWLATLDPFLPGRVQLNRPATRRQADIAQRALELGHDGSIVVTRTHTTGDPNDPAYADPTNPIYYIVQR